MREIALANGVAETINTNIASVGLLYIKVDESTPGNVQIVKDGEATNWQVSSVFLALGIGTCTSLQLTSDADVTVQICIGG